MKLLTALLAVILAATCMAQSHERPSFVDVSDCRDINVSAQVDDCIRREKLNSDILLSSSFAGFEEHVKHIYSADLALGEELIERLAEAQAAWAAFRDANCRVEAFEAENGTPPQLTLINSCVARMNAERAEYLGKLMR